MNHLAGVACDGQPHPSIANILFPTRSAPRACPARPPAPPACPQVLKQQAAQMQGCETKDLSAGVVMAAGGTGGILYWLAIFPVDVVKSAMMTDSIDPATRKYPNIPTTARVSSSAAADGGERVRRHACIAC